MSKPLILASNNAKKLRELQALIAPLGVGLITQGALGIPEAEEPHVTFVENALSKARHAARLGGGPALADDSGLCINALGGAPGVRSARYAVDAGRVAEDVGRERIDPANNAWLLEQMATHTDRQAHFTCLLVAVRHADDPEPLIAEGHWCGQLLHAPQGEHGFGYDPLLWLPEHQLSAAQLAPEIKNAVSHRALACQQLLQLITARWGIIGTDGSASAHWPWQSA
ncbi:MAG: RdgB/HAM1 family non-canonical purine NTP pyrophosphatase [Aquabacterium sp.]|jgi:XTP/dITP diphosphohydrolase|uniref:RdgB/HAM1 family non-canonical purine NTP pyrophosphatase n=1 Tax=Aquabacterium sp. TaxID=1872578 RepID=UPI001B6297C5|nr:RdgB/HAM1 family non-canonical purine NTP pyrophosphatase [Aquabacterium sp.]MBP7131359.1 RdgB/HAM1 family non-canonical purine NTP pyrophosphatase [Aquabacterium sp.]MBP9062878.1 RdgB/HAM1 family non-canonical purine NTP pyrophosphatase [Aquabacterium sp.]